MMAHEKIFTLRESQLHQGNARDISHSTHRRADYSRGEDACSQTHTRWKSLPGHKMVMSFLSDIILVKSEFTFSFARKGRTKASPHCHPSA